MKTVEVTVDVPADAYRLAQVPALYFIVATLTGVSITFSPLFIYELGREGVTWSDWRLWACFGVTFLVPLFYARLGAAVAAQAWKNPVILAVWIEEAGQPPVRLVTVQPR